MALKKLPGPLFSQPKYAPFDAKKADADNRKAAARKKQVKKQTAQRNTGGRAPAPPPPPARDALGNRTTFGTNGPIGKAVAKTQAKSQAAGRRAGAIESYTSAPKAERVRQAARAQKRVEQGKGSQKDQLILDAHYRRTKQQASTGNAKAVRAANVAHDQQVAADRSKRLLELVQRTTDNISKAAEERAKPKRSGLAKFADSFVGPGATDVATGAVKAAKGIAGDVKEIAENSAAKTAAGGPGNPVSASVIGNVDNPTSRVARAALAPVGVASSVAQVVAEDPKQAAKLPLDVAKMVKDIPAGVLAAANDPEGAGKGVLADYKRRYGDLISGNEAAFRARMKKEGIAPEVVDVLGVVGGESVGATRAVGAAAKKVSPGGRLDRAINADRPDLLVAPGVAKPQRKSSNLPILAAQRATDRVREKRVVRELNEAAAKRQSPPPATTRKQERLNDKADRPGRGSGVRGMVPSEGQVVPRLASTRKRKLTQQIARTQGTAFRRMDRLSNALTRDAGRRFRALSKTEQLAAVHALEGTVNPDNVPASIAAIDRRVGTIEKERADANAADPEAFEMQYAPLAGRPGVDELVQLQRLRRQLEADPGRVFTGKLKSFVETERQRRPEVERVAGDSLRPSTVEARRFAPAGDLLGTRSAYEAERQALDLLEESKGNPAPVVAKLDKQIEAAPAAKRPELKRLRGTVLRVSRDTAPGDVGAARTAAVERFVERTKQRGERAGLDVSDPVFVKHRKSDTGGAGVFAAGGGEKGAVAGAKRSDLSLFRKGFRDTSDRAYEQGIGESVKRSTQWRMVNELYQDLVPDWAKNDGKGFTAKEWQQAVHKRMLDPQDWVAWKANRIERKDATSLDDDLPEDGAIDGIPDEDMQPLSDKVLQDWATTGQKFFVIPVDALNEMKRGHGPLEGTGRGMGKFTSTQSQLILGTNPAYGIRQAGQNVPMTLIAIGGRVADPVFRRNLQAYRKAAKLNTREFNDMLDVMGVRSKSMDAVRNERRGSQAFDQRRFEGALTHTWGGLFGASVKDYFVAQRHSPTALGTASQAARTAGKIVGAPFRLTRDGNMMFDAWQDRLARTLALAATDARMAGSIRQNWTRDVAVSTTDNAKRLGPIARSLELPEDQLAALARTAEFRHTLNEAADGITKWLGDYANYTQKEQAVLRRVIPFYGFARHSTRLLVNVLPIEHPVTFAAALSLSGASGEAKEKMLIDFMKRIGRAAEVPKMLAGLALIAGKNDDLQVVDASWMNPLTGPAFELLAEGPTSATSSVLSPLLKGFGEDIFQTNAFTHQKLTNAGGAVDQNTNPLTVVDQTRVVLNRLGQSLYPYRVANDLVNGRRGKLTDTSLLIDPVEYPYKRTESGKKSVAMKRNDQRIKDSKAYGAADRVLDSTLPLRKKPATSLLNSAEYEAQSKAKPKPKRQSTYGGGYGGYGGSGSTGYSGGGY